MRHITQEGLDLIKRFEGFSPKVYVCPAGYRTIGYGHVVRPGENFSVIQEDYAEEILARDVQSAERSVLNLIKVSLSDEQFNALVSFTFNCGGAALQRSTLRRKVNREEHEDVPEELLKWCRGGGKILKGLLRRRQAEADMYSDGTMPEFPGMRFLQMKL